MAFRAAAAADGDGAIAGTGRELAGVMVGRTT